MIHRLINTPLSKKNFNHEVSNIKRIVALNNICIDVDKIISRKLKRKALDHTSTFSTAPSPRMKWIRLPFFGNVSYKLSHILRNVGFRTAFYILSNFSFLARYKDSLPVSQKNGIYRIECGECDGVYIGQTGRNIDERFREHSHAVKNILPHKSAFAKHVIDSDHDGRN